MKVIKTDTTTFLETTLRCYVGCDWCYRKPFAHPRADHVPLDVLRKRVDWICEYVDTPEIGQIGGEPFLSPCFRELTNYIISKGKDAMITTSFKLPNTDIEKKNVEFALELYEAGLLYIAMSIYPGKNEKEIKWLLDEIKKRSVKHFQNREAMGRSNEGRSHAHVLIMVPDISYADPKKLKEWVVRVLDMVGYNAPMKDGKDYLTEVVAPAVAGHFAEAPFSETRKMGYNVWANAKDRDFLVRFLIASPDMITIAPDGTHQVKTARGRICGAARSTLTDTHVDTQPLLVKTNGDVVFSEPYCIAMERGLCNTDVHVNERAVLEVTTRSLKQILAHVYMANRRQAACEVEKTGKETECTACPLNDMCGSCHTRPLVW